MALYLIGDLQGCNDALSSLLNTLNFSPSRDTIYLLGDLVNRGPDSLGVLRRLSSLGSAAQCILGNHDLHCLAVAYGARALGRSDTLGALLAADDSEPLLEWLRHRPLAIHAHGFLMVHAGVLPQWNTTDVIAHNDHITLTLRSKSLKVVKSFFSGMFGDTPDTWQEDLQGIERQRLIVNALTRLRFCSIQGQMELTTKEGAGAAPPGYLPWFDVPGRLTADTTIAFGHWSRQGLVHRPHLIGLDTGCVWGGCLSAMRFDGGRRELVQISCA
jgi:bis(5'-nucleosyl)-tetraphosphatase (symmetrical)